MLEQNFQSVYEKFKLQFFRRLFSQVREREGSLSAMEAFSVEVIHESDKFYCHNGLMQSYIDTVLARIHERFTPEELATFEHVLAVMSDELMPECDVPKK